MEQKSDLKTALVEVEVETELVEVEVETELVEVDSKTEVINVSVKNIRPQYSNLHQWILDKESNVYIGRARVVFIDGIKYPFQDSIWANPYKITETMTRDKVLKLYRTHIEEKIKSDPTFVEELKKLDGKKLGCWCKPECCHGDIIKEFLEKYKNT